MPSSPRGPAAIAAAIDGWATRLLPFARGVLLGPVLFGSNAILEIIRRGRMALLQRR